MRCFRMSPEVLSPALTAAPAELLAMPAGQGGRDTWGSYDEGLFLFVCVGYVHTRSYPQESLLLCGEIRL